MHPEKKNALLVFGGYVFAVLIIVYFNNSPEYKSGPCTPNLDLLSILLFGPVSFVLTLISAYKTFTKHQPKKYVFAMHALAFIGWVLLLVLNK